MTDVLIHGVQKRSIFYNQHAAFQTFLDILNLTFLFQSIDKNLIVICQITSLHVCTIMINFENMFLSRTKSRKEKNKLASRACRLKKKAQHEANKIKLSGLDDEHSM